MECPHGGSSEVGVQVPVGAESGDYQAEEQGCDRCRCPSDRGKVVLSCPTMQKQHVYRQIIPHIHLSCAFPSNTKTSITEQCQYFDEFFSCYR